MILFREVDVHGEVVVVTGFYSFKKMAQLAGLGLQTLDGGDVVGLLGSGERPPVRERWGVSAAERALSAGSSKQCLTTYHSRLTAGCVHLQAAALICANSSSRPDLRATAGCMVPSTEECRGSSDAGNG